MGKNKYIYVIYIIFIVFITTNVILVNITSIKNISNAASDNDPKVKIGDITWIEGVRENQLQGLGLVVGLSGSGDSRQSGLTTRALSNMLEKEGNNISSDDLTSRNVAVVMVTAYLPPFARSGDQIEVTVSSMGDARSLQGGQLLMTPLKAPNGEVYAVAQGALTIGGYNERSQRFSVRKNHPTVGQIPNGALVEKELEFEFDQDKLSYILRRENYETASEIAAEINKYFAEELDNDQLARPLDAKKVEIKIPESFQDKVVDFISTINKLKVQTYIKAKVVVNERTGTIVMGHNVKISGVYFVKGSYAISITSEEVVSHPPPFSDGETIVTSEEDIEVREEEVEIQEVEGEGDIKDLVTALNAVGASSRDIIAIIKEIDAVGALHASLEVQ